MKHMALSVLTALAVVVFSAPGAFPDTINWTDTQYETGTGFGNITNVLSLANKTSETGSVYPASSFSGAENIYLARTDLPHTIIPEASAIFLFGSGLVGLVAYRRKRRMA